jgi:O-antigen/teichoic acid export membrane protein
MLKAGKQLLSNPFIRHNAVFFIGSLAVSALNYLYYPVLGRMLTASDFGEVQTLVSLFLQATIFLTVVTNVAVNIVANERDATLRSRIVYELEHASTLIALGALALALIFVPQLEKFLQFQQVGPFFALALSLLVSVPGALRNAYLRGRSAFGQLSISGIIGSLTKIIFSAGFVFLGWRTTGAIGGLVVAQILALIYSMVTARRLGLEPVEGLKLWRRPDIKLIRPHLPYAGLVLIVSLVTTALFSFDVIVVKHYFPAEIAGYYAGIATVARIIYFLTASIAAVLLSTIKLDATPRENRRLLLRSALLQTVLGGGTLIVFTAVPHLITQILIGTKYTHYAFLLPKLSLALFFMSGINLIFNYDLALRRKSAAFVSILGAAAMALIVIMHHASLAAVVDSLVWGSLVVLLLRAADSARRYIKNHRPSYDHNRPHQHRGAMPQ